MKKKLMHVENEFNSKAIVYTECVSCRVVSHSADRHRPHYNYPVVYVVYTQSEGERGLTGSHIYTRRRAATHVIFFLL